MEAFYRGGAPEQLRAAVADAERVDPTSAGFHELAAELSALEGRDADVFNHLYQALLDANDDAPQLHLHQLCALEWTFEERARATALLRTLSAAHPMPQLRALAAWHLAHLLNGNGELPSATRS